jgi:hypothetical protein
MEHRAKKPAFVGPYLLVGLAVLCAGCSGHPQVNGSLGDATPETAEPFDPTAPLASRICDDDQGTTGIYVFSAMNHKLAHYPAFAEAFGTQLVSECETAVRFEAAYADYLQAHPGFDADEPLPPSPEGEAAAFPDDILEKAEQEVQKVGGVVGTNVDNAIVKIQFDSCSTHLHKNGRFCPNADASWVVNGADLRHNTSICTGTFISKNWILTAAHCITLAAVDSCMDKGVSRTNCVPKWDNYGKWVVEGTYNTEFDAQGIPISSPVTYREVFGMRAYVDTEWRGRNLSTNEKTCTTTDCARTDLAADHDLALLYIDRRNDGRLPPRVEDDAAKRLNITFPLASWTFAVGGWGDPPGNMGQEVFRQGDFPAGTIMYPQGALSNQMVVSNFAGNSAAYVCHGDSGGPVLRTGLQVATNRNIVKSNVEAIVAVNSSSNAHCDGTTEPSPILWRATLIHTPNHRKFIHDSMNRWPWTAQTCVEKSLNNTGPKQVEECWGKPCTFDGTPCTKDETCQGQPREIFASLPVGDSMCKVCQGFPGTNPTTGARLDLDCNCLEGQCVKDP